MDNCLAKAAKQTSRSYILSNGQRNFSVTSNINILRQLIKLLFIMCVLLCIAYRVCLLLRSFDNKKRLLYMYCMLQDPRMKFS